MALVLTLDSHIDEKEAEIQFELYRLIKNQIEMRNHSLEGYVGVTPEVGVGPGAADLVVEKRAEGTEVPFLVIETKRRSPQSMQVFSDPPKDQAKGYATKLHAEFYAVSDGEVLGLFRTSDDSGRYYAMSLDEAFVSGMLRGILDIHSGKRQDLPFPTVTPPFAAIAAMTSGISKDLSVLFERLQKTGLIEVKRKGNVLWIYVGSAGAVLRLGLYGESNGDSIDVRFNLLKNLLKDNFERMVVNLSQVPGFEWVTEGNWRVEPNKWKEIRKIALGQPDLKQMYKGLTAWLREVASLSH